MISNFEVLNPDDYRLANSPRYLELVDTVERLETSSLGDLSLYCKRPDWFVTCEKSGRIDYDPRVGLRMILEAKRKLMPNERPEDLLQETLDKISPNKKKLRAARKTVAEFIATATACMELRGVQNPPADKLAYYIGDVSSKLGDVRCLSGTIPESIIRACEDMSAAVIQPCPPEQTWEQTISAGSRRAVSIGDP